MRRRIAIVTMILIALAGLVLVATVGRGAWRLWRDPRAGDYLQWSQGQHEGLITVQREACAGAPFILPADGYIGLFYDDPRPPYSPSRPHQGIDVFSPFAPGLTPVYAAYDGYLTREDDWTSTVIQRVPDDPLQPGRQIWLYYTHLADREGNDFIVDAFPRGTSEVFIEQGTLLGYTGDYNGNSAREIWVHLHFSIVRDDGRGNYTNELEFSNTIDPTPYLGLPVNYSCAPAEASGMVCAAAAACTSP